MRIFSKLAVGAAVLLTAVSLRADLAGGTSGEPGAGLVGHYSYIEPGTNPKAVFIDLDVKRGQGGKLSVDFGGAHMDASGAAPDGDGTGKVDDKGTLHFDFEDSFENKGTGTLARTGADSYRLFIDIKEVKDIRCLVFYGEHVLKRSRKRTRS